jgi:hypothetical protein
MINHIRTLLLNENGSNKPGAGYPLEEYVPPDFQAIKLPFELKKVWCVLFGLNPDRAYKNWRLHQLLRAAEVSSLFKECLKFDSRSTVFGLNDKTVDGSYGKLIITNVTNRLSSTYVQQGSTLQTASGDSSEDVKAFLAGSLSSDDNKGVCYGLYSLKTNNTQITATNLANGSFTQFTQVGSSSNGYRPPVKYISELNANIYLSSDSVGEWYVEYVSRPALDLGVVLANLKNLADIDIDFLFSGDLPEYKKFKDYWHRGTDLVDRVTAVVLGLAYKIEEARIKS